MFALVKVPAAGSMSDPSRQDAIDEIELAGRVYKNEHGRVAVLDFHSGDIDDNIAQRDLRHLLAKAMVASLKPRHRMVITRRYFEGSSLKDVAQELQVTLPAVARIEKKALERMSRADNLVEFINARKKAKA